MSDQTARLILFDIDGTLISTGGRAGLALARALEETYGTAGPVASYPFAGKTDPQIVFELLAAAGLPRERVAPRLDEALGRYLGHLRRALAPGTVEVLPGVHDVLAALEGEPGVTVALLTGNIAAGARVKLGAAGLWERFRFGAFGSDDEVRDRLVPVARERARATVGLDFPGDATVVVGDAEADVRCARAGAARAVAVASGWTGRETLAALRPDALLDSLADPGAMSALLDGAAGPTRSPRTARCAGS